MAEVVVIGAGVGGLGSALSLARAGHRVTVVERDPIADSDSPDAAFEHWSRPGAPQTRHSHAFLARLRNLLRDRSPELLDELLAAGASEVDFTRHPPPALHPLEPQAGDEDLVALACRRTTFEWVLRRHALAVPAISMVRGVVQGLVTKDLPSAVPHVVGVGLADGAMLGADLVVDASGRRSPLPRWIKAVSPASPPVPESQEDAGVIYSSRFYRVLDHDDDPSSHGLVVGDLGYIKYALFPGDNGTLSITFGIPSDDRELRRVLQPDAFTAAGRAFPAIRGWMEEGRCRPITGVEVMGGLINRSRRFVVNATPLVTGVYAVGDSSVCTNPIYGRGCALALVHAELLADTLEGNADDPVAAAVSFDHATRAEIEPWYKATLAQDRHDRLSDDEGGGVGVGSLMRNGLLPAARSDPLVFRAFIRAFNLLDPPDALMREPGVVMRVMAAWQERGHRPPPPPLGPDRGGLLGALDGAA